METAKVLESVVLSQIGGIVTQVGICVSWYSFFIVQMSKSRDVVLER